MELLIRRYRPSDKDSVLSLYSIGIREHIRPCFLNAMTSPLYLTVTLALCVAGHLLGSALGAVVLPGAWVGLVYYCCHLLYAGYVRKVLQTDMRDIPGNYMSRPDDGFWVAEAEVDGRTRILGMVALVTKESGKERYGELVRMIISPSCRRMGLGFRMAQTVIDFCQERGLSKVALETSSTQAAALSLYEKLGFSHIASHTHTHVSNWVVTLTMVSILVMEKRLSRLS